MCVGTRSSFDLMTEESTAKGRTVWDNYKTQDAQDDTVPNNLLKKIERGRGAEAAIRSNVLLTEALLLSSRRLEIRQAVQKMKT